LILGNAAPYYSVANPKVGKKGPLKIIYRFEELDVFFEGEFISGDLRKKYRENNYVLLQLAFSVG
jgi:hypothetical protein